MKNVFTTIAIVLSLFTGTVTIADAAKEKAIAAKEYGYCHDLKLRMPIQDEIIIFQQCDAIIEAYELNLEKTVAENRIKAIKIRLKAIEITPNQ